MPHYDGDNGVTDDDIEFAITGIRPKGKNKPPNTSERQNFHQKGPLPGTEGRQTGSSKGDTVYRSDGSYQGETRNSQVTSGIAPQTKAFINGNTVSSFPGPITNPYGKAENGRVYRRVLFGWQEIGTYSKSDDPQQVLAHFVLLYDDLKKEVDRLKDRFRYATDKKGLLNEILRMKDNVKNAKVLGDTDSLIRELESLESQAKTASGKEKKGIFPWES